MLKKLKIWIYAKILKRQYIVGVDYSSGKDYNVQASVYKDSRGVIHITNLRILR